MCAFGKFVDEFPKPCFFFFFFFCDVCQKAGSQIRPGGVSRLACPTTAPNHKDNWTQEKHLLTTHRPESPKRGDINKQIQIHVQRVQAGGGCTVSEAGILLFSIGESGQEPCLQTHEVPAD